MAPNDPLRVLILDDERVIVDAYCIILNHSGFEARGVYRHRAAIQAAQEFRPDIFLTGFVNSDEENGCETAAEVLIVRPDCRIIVFSGSAASALFVDDFNRRGYAFEFFPKPVHPQDLMIALREPRGGPFLLTPENRRKLERSQQERAPEDQQLLDAPDRPVEPIRRRLRKFRGLLRRRNPN